MEKTAGQSVSITRALRELKTLDDRISKKINQSIFVYAKKKNENLPKQFKHEEEFKKDAQSNLQSIQDLMERRKRIKTAIVESNAKTEVEIAGEVMTVADAIERKNYINYEKLLLSKLKSDYAAAENKMERNNSYAEQRIHENINNFLQGENKYKETAIEAMQQAFWENEKTEIIDPIHIAKTIEELEEKIDKFENEVDAVLSESNSITKIIVPE